MPLPLVLWGAAAALGATGIYKGVKAKSMLDEAKEIGEKAENRLRNQQERLDTSRQMTNEALETFGKKKVEVMSNQIQHLVEVMKRGRNRISGFESSISAEQLKECERMVAVALKIESGLGSGTAAGALAAMGAYGSVGMLATASTGAAISGLSGVAATNATLAWLGGGSLAAGGFGMAGGMLALGGIVMGPALAVGGFMLASKAEEALTSAHAYEARVDEAVAKIKIGMTGLKAIRTNVAELSNVISELAIRYDSTKVDTVDDKARFKRMSDIGKAIKEVLNIPVLDEQGTATLGLSAKLSGYKEVAGPLARVMS